MNTKTELVVDTWISLARAYKYVFLSIEDALKSSKLPKLEWYDILWELEKNRERGIRPFELQDKMLLAQYSVSRLVDKLEKAGYLKRTISESDGRGQVLFITDEGRFIREKMWAVYSKAIAKTFYNKLDEEQAKSLISLLGKLPV